MNWLNKRLIINMGKGGVGKSFFSATLARLALDQGKRVLLVQVNTQDKICGYLGMERSDDTIRELLPNLFSVNISPQSALKEYVVMQVKLEMIYRLVFENRAVHYFLRAVPALNDLVTLGKIYYHVGQKTTAGKPLYDLVIVDAPPTGHGLFLLELPLVMLRVVKGGPIQREAGGMLEMLRDPKVTAINLVTLLEEMPVSETLEMYARIKDTLKMPLGVLLGNVRVPERLTDGDMRVLSTIQEKKNEPDRLRPLLDLAHRVDARHRLNTRYEQVLKEQVSLPFLTLPAMFEETFGPETVARATALLKNQLKGEW